MRTTRFLIGAASLALVAVIAVWVLRDRASPGPLHPSHADVPRLRGGAGCVVCHGAKQATLADACAACHDDVLRQIESAAGLHGAIPKADAAVCGACHREHSGGVLGLVAPMSFAAAGVPDPNAYDHHHAPAYGLAGRHQTLECVRCHLQAHAPMLEPGQKRYMGLSQECVSCHMDPHRGDFGPDCLGCHGQSHEFRDVPGFRHDAFRLEGAHFGLACSECHTAGSATSVAALRTGAFTPRDCVSCHDDPHEGTLGGDCASCHGVTRPFDQAAGFAHTEEFPLVGGHAGRACRQCHEPSGPHAVPALRLRAASPRACVDCHESPHRAETVQRFAASIGSPGDSTCTECHAAEHGTFQRPAAAMTLELHRATGFALDPPHDKAECAACHAGLGTRKPLPDGAERRIRFAALFPGRGQNECRACHQDPHLGQFNAGPTGGDCIRCHAATHFVPSEFDVSHHGRSAFPLTGAHRAVACALCHEPDGDGPRFVPTPAACAECHADVHGAAFDGPDAPAAFNGAVGCARCHTTESFGAVSWNGSAHALWTGYELRGGHASASCVDCHKRTARPDDRGRTLGIAPTDCNACHADPHAGQFRIDQITDCARCHTETRPFGSTTFDHQRDSEFVLDEHHAKLECAACHRPVQVAPGRSVVRYRPLGTRCQDCHRAEGPS